MTTTTDEIMELAEKWRWCRLDSVIAAEDALRTAVERLVAERDELRSKAEHIMTFVEGDLPTRGWLRDNDKSRAAIAELRAALEGKP